MANTKQITDRTERKAKKRELRKGFKAVYSKLTKAQRRRFRNSETVGVKKWLAEEAANES